MNVYFVTALDADNNELARYESGSNKRVAIQEARATFRSDQELRDSGMVRVTVTDEDTTVWEDLR